MISSGVVALIGVLALGFVLPTYAATSTTTISATTTSAPPPVVTVSQYGQCGGQGYTGSTVCPTDWICTYSSAFESQCLPGPNYTPPPPPPPPTTTTTTFIPQQTWDYLISFGDTWTNTGFDIEGTKPAIGNQLGNPAFPGATTSGGRNWVSSLVSFNSQLLSYNFASAGATINSSIIAPKVKGARSLVDQVAQFTSNMVPPPAYAPWYYNSTLFVIWSGNVDAILAWDKPNWSTLVQELINSYWEQVQILYSAGARSFLFLEIPEIDQTPAMLKRTAAERKAMAAAIAQFNALLNDETFTLINSCWGDQFPNYAAGSPCFAQVITSGWSFMLDNPTVYGVADNSCINPDGVSCLWTDEWNPGWILEDIFATYIGVDVGLYVS